jgi:hypothetical protein
MTERARSYLLTLGVSLGVALLGFAVTWGVTTERVANIRVEVERKADAGVVAANQSAFNAWMARLDTKMDRLDAKMDRHLELSTRRR